MLTVQSITMSSREIATLTGKRHNNVIRDIEAMLEQLEIDVLKFEHIYLDTRNRKQTEYLLPKRETLILISGYNVHLRAAIIDRWQHLEENAKAELERQAERHAARLEAPEMTAALLASRRDREGKATSHYHYSNEYNMINRIVMGLSSKQLREEAGLKDSDPLRDSLSAAQVAAVADLQRVNTVLIDTGFSYAERKERLVELYHRKHSLKIKAEVDRLEG